MMTADSTSNTPREDQYSSLSADQRARREWIWLALAISVNAILGIGAYLVHFRYPLPRLELLFAWYPLFLAASLPQLAEASVRPFIHRRPRYVKDSIVIKGNHENIARIITGFAQWLLAAGTFIVGLITGYPLHAAICAFFVGLWAYVEGTHQPLADLSIALRDRQTITLTPKGIYLHFPPPLSCDSPGWQTEVSFAWGDGVYIDCIIGSDLYLLGEKIAPDSSIICSRHLGIPYTGLDALMRHFNEHPEDRILLATTRGVDLVNGILAEARAALTNSHRSRA
ncbi:hypothetical protein [Actinomyces sp.]